MNPQSFILRLDCPDRPGIVAAVSGALRDHGCNIEESAQFNDHLSGRFFMRTVFSPGPKGQRGFAAEFEGIAAAFSMTHALHPADERPRILLMVSRADHCLHDIIYRWRTGHLPVDIAAIVSNHEDCRALSEERGLRFVHLPVTADNKAAQEAALHRLARETGTELIVLARYMQILSPDFCALYPGRIINIHHSFLPGFKGARPYHQAYARGVKLIGATAHFVTADLDEGPIIEQETVRITHSMTPDELQMLGKDLESQVLAKSLHFYVKRRIFLHGIRTIIL